MMDIKKIFLAVVISSSAGAAMAVAKANAQVVFTLSISDPYLGAGIEISSVYLDRSNAAPELLEVPSSMGNTSAYAHASFGDGAGLPATNVVADSLPESWAQGTAAINPRVVTIKNSGASTTNVPIGCIC